jgi:transcriptional regulator with XRE-family HTH domain
MTYIIRKKTHTQISQIAEKLKQLRIDSGFTSYEQFANHHDIDRKQYWRVEAGANITLESLIKILELHNLSLADFFKKLT